MPGGRERHHQDGYRERDDAANQHFLDAQFDQRSDRKTELTVHEPDQHRDEEHSARIRIQNVVSPAEYARHHGYHHQQRGLLQCRHESHAGERSSKRAREPLGAAIDGIRAGTRAKKHHEGGDHRPEPALGRE